MNEKYKPVEVFDRDIDPSHIWYQNDAELREKEERISAVIVTNDGVQIFHRCDGFSFRYGWKNGDMSRISWIQIFEGESLYMEVRESVCNIVFTPPALPAKAESFALSQVLSITTGKLLCDLDSVYDLLNFLTGDTLFTHQRTRAMDFCKPLILARYLELSAVNFVGMCPDNYYEIFTSEIQRLNLSYEYELSPFSGWHCKDPVKEAEDIFGAERVITVMV